MKIYKVLLLCLMFCSSYGQELQNTVSKTTSAHKIIPGTKFSVIPPQGFKMEAIIKGLMMEHGVAKIKTMTLSKSMFSDIKNTVSEKKFNSYGISGTKIQRFLFNDKEAIWVSFESTDAPGIDTHNHLLYIEIDQGKGAVINAKYQSSLKDILDQDIRKAMLSIVYHPERKISDLDELGITLDLETYGLKKQGGFWGGSVSFVGDGTGKPLSDPAFSYTITHAPTRYEIEDKKEFVINYGYKEIRSKNITADPITIGGLEGYELYFSQPNDKEQIIKTYALILLFDDQNYYALQGIIDSKEISPQEFDEIKTHFRALSQSLKKM